MKLNTWIVGLLIVASIVAGYIFRDKIFNTQPKVEVGESVKDLGREHVDDISKIEYSSNPPTSGPHFVVWAKRGLYDRLISDGYLIHSLEHGYVIVSVDCTKLNSQASRLIPEVFAHEDDLPLVVATASGTPLTHMNFNIQNNVSSFDSTNPPAVEKPLPQDFETPQCTQLVESLRPLLDKYDRFIIAPRVGMDSLIAVTAWGRILKMDSVDQEKIDLFVKTYHNKGPEKTME